MLRFVVDGSTGCTKPDLLFCARVFGESAISAEDLSIPLHRVSSWAIPENKEIKTGNSVFFCQRHALLTSFDIFVVTYRVPNFLLKLVIDMLLFSMKNLNFYFWFSPIFGLCRLPSVGPVHTGRRAACNTCTQIMEHTAINGSVHTGCTQHQRVCTQICMQICLRVLCEWGLRARMRSSAS